MTIDSAGTTFKIFQVRGEPDGVAKPASLEDSGVEDPSRKPADVEFVAEVRHCHYDVCGKALDAEKQYAYRERV